MNQWLCGDEYIVIAALLRFVTTSYDKMLKLFSTSPNIRHAFFTSPKIRHLLVSSWKLFHRECMAVFMPDLRPCVCSVVA